MEKRTARVNFSTAGGTASKDSITCKITLPTSWLEAMSINDMNRIVDISFNNYEIIISQRLIGEEFIKQKIKRNHDVKIYNFYDKNNLCSTIYADCSDKTLVVENHINDPVKTAFGNNKNPTWVDFLTFLKNRCIPGGRDGLREYLEALGLVEYSPLSIIKKTNGRMAEDNQWLEEKPVL
jgi:hypothetical protein